MQPTPCSVADCAKLRRGRSDYCRMHSNRLKKHGTLDLPKKERAQCSTEGCANFAVSRGLCNKHYIRLRTHGDPTYEYVPTARPVPERFWEKVDKRDVGDCWEWQGTLCSKGYGVIDIGGRQHKAHRISYQLNIGHLPDELFVCHHCDNPRCVNPNHLYAGTVHDNGRDMASRRRSMWGERNSHARITSEVALEILDRHREGESVPELMARFDVSRSLVRHLVSRRRWVYLDDDAA